MHETGQVGAVDELHHQEMKVASLLGIVGRHDVGMQGQAGGRLDLAPEPFHQGLVPQEVPANDFQGDRAVHQPMLGEIDRAHAADSQPLLDPVAGMVRKLRGKLLLKDSLGRSRVVRVNGRKSRLPLG